MLCYPWEKGFLYYTQFLVDEMLLVEEVILFIEKDSLAKKHTFTAFMPKFGFQVGCS